MTPDSPRRAWLCTPALSLEKEPPSLKILDPPLNNQSFLVYIHVYTIIFNQPQVCHVSIPLGGTLEWHRLMWCLVNQSRGILWYKTQ